MDTSSVKERSDTQIAAEKFQRDRIGERYMGASLSSINLGENMSKVNEWLKKKEGFLVFLGAPGIGKTYFCSAIIPWIHGRVAHYRYWNEGQFLSSIRQCIQDSKGDYTQFLWNLIDDELVIFDDFGSNGFNEWRAEVLFNAIDKRYESHKPTVITSNLTREEIYDGIGPRGASRIFASSNLIIEDHHGSDLRKEGK